MFGWRLSTYFSLLQGERDILIIGILYWHMFTKVYTYRMFIMMIMTFARGFPWPLPLCRPSAPNSLQLDRSDQTVEKRHRGHLDTVFPSWLLLLMFKSINSQENQLTQQVEFETQQQPVATKKLKNSPLTEMYQKYDGANLKSDYCPSLLGQETLTFISWAGLTNQNPAQKYSWLAIQFLCGK